MKYTYGEGVVDLGFESFEFEGVDNGINEDWFGKPARLCYYRAPEIECEPDLRYVDGFWKWMDITLDFTLRELPLPSLCREYIGFQRFQTWITLNQVDVVVARSLIDNTVHVSVGAAIQHTKSKAVWGTETITTRDGYGDCSTTVTEHTEAEAIPFCRANSVCTTGAGGSCCFAGFWQAGLWGPFSTAAMAYDGIFVFAPNLLSGWQVPGSSLVATGADTLYEFRQSPILFDPPVQCRVPTGVTTLDYGSAMWSCGDCGSRFQNYTWEPETSLSLTHKIEIEW